MALAEASRTPIFSALTSVPFQHQLNVATTTRFRDELRSGPRFDSLWSIWSIWRSLIDGETFWPHGAVMELNGVLQLHTGDIHSSISALPQNHLFSSTFLLQQAPVVPAEIQSSDYPYSRFKGPSQ